MKFSKRVLACLLAVTVLFGCFPTLGVTAEVATQSDAKAELTTAYDDLYVQSGLVMLLSAYSHESAGLVNENGVYTGWTNKVDGTVVSFHNHTDASNSANNIHWKLRTGKGIGYDLTAAQHGSGFAKSIGMNAYLYLGDGIVDVCNDYTVEYASTIMRVSENGTQVSNGGDFHNTGSSTEKFGAWGTWVFRLNQTADSLRPTYFPSSPSDGYGNNGTPPWNIPVWGNDPSVKTSSNVISVNVAEKTSFRDFYANGEHYTWMSIKQNNNQTYNSVITDSTEFWLMQNCANTLYAVRVYDRALSADEIAWNTLVDIAAYVGADVKSLASLTVYERVTVANACAALTFASSKATVEGAISAGVALLDRYAPTAEGYQKGNDGTSLRIWSMIDGDTVSDASMLGMVIAVTGDAEKVYSGETKFIYSAIKSGNKIVATAGEGEYFFAAVMDGIPRSGSYVFTITPYAIVDGAKIYGKSVTLEWPAVE